MTHKLDERVLRYEIRNYIKRTLQEADTDMPITDDEQAQLEKEMGAALSAFKSQVQSADQIEEARRQVNEANIKLNEALGAVAIIGAILAAPKVVEIITKGISKLIKAFKKLVGMKVATTDEQRADAAKRIIDFTHKWHKAYIKLIKFLLARTGILEKAGIKSPADQMKAAEVVYYTIVASLAIYSGVGAISAFKTAVSTSASGGEFALGTFEAVMASVKTAEVKEFMTKIFNI
jgi:hypothetical protein